MRSPGFTVHFGDGVADVLRHADHMISEAHAWIGTAECRRIYQDAGKVPSWYEFEDRIREMEPSLLRSLRLVITLAAGPGGELRIGWDSERSLVLGHPPSGLTGVMIFHPDQVNGNAIPVGSWTLHS
jgi:hypothetical protein